MVMSLSGVRCCRRYPPTRADSDALDDGSDRVAARGAHGTRTYFGRVAQLAAGYCLGSPLRAGIEAHGDPDAVTAAVAEDMKPQLGPGPMTGRMTALVVEATTSAAG